MASERNAGILSATAIIVLHLMISAAAWGAPEFAAADIERISRTPHLTAGAHGGAPEYRGLAMPPKAGRPSP